MTPTWVNSTVHNSCLHLCSAAASLTVKTNSWRDLWADTTGKHLKASRVWYCRSAAGHAGQSYWKHNSLVAFDAVLSVVAGSSMKAACYWAQACLPIPQDQWWRTSLLFLTKSLSELLREGNRETYIPWPSKEKELKEPCLLLIMASNGTLCYSLSIKKIKVAQQVNPNNLGAKRWQGLQQKLLWAPSIGNSTGEIKDLGLLQVTARIRPFAEWSG